MREYCKMKRGRYNVVLASFLQFRLDFADLTAKVCECELLLYFLKALNTTNNFLSLASGTRMQIIT